MNAIAIELDQKLQRFAPETAASVEQLVRDALRLAEKKENGAATWPVDFWQNIREDWGTEPFERPAQHMQR